MGKIYQVEFSDNVSRRYNEMPHNMLVKANSKSEAKKKLIDYLKKIFNLKKNKIIIENVEEINYEPTSIDIRWNLKFMTPLKEALDWGIISRYELKYLQPIEAELLVSMRDRKYQLKIRKLERRIWNQKQ